MAIIGCGGRGTGAVGNALSAPGGPTKLFAMADLFENRLAGSHKALSNQFGAQIEVPPERRFLGFDAYRKAMVTGRYLPNCFNDFASFVHGTKCAAQFSGNVHAPTVQMYRDQRIADDNVDWKPTPETINPWQAEWNVLLDDIRNDRPHNEAKRAAYSNLATLMGRAAVHTGKIITWEEATASDFVFCPDLGALAADSPAPVQADAEGRYPAPMPGASKEF